MGRYKVAAGLDLHAAMIQAGLRRERGRKVILSARSFGTTRQQLWELRDWLKEEGCEAVGMEATGVFWKPVFRELEGHMRVVVGNPQHMRVLRGRKTDKRDAAWITQKTMDDEIPPSFIAPLEVRERSEVARLRENLVEEQTRVRNEIHKLLRGAGVPLKDVVSDLFGVSGMAILESLARGESAWEKLPGMLRGKLRKKVDTLRLALEVPLTEVQQWEMSFQLKRLEEARKKLDEVEEELERRLAPFEEVRARIATTPGIGRLGAGLVIAHVGTELAKSFPDGGNFASWMGLVPGDNETSGKQKAAPTRKGNKYLRSLFVEFAWAAVRTKGCWLKSKYWSLRARMLEKKAIVAIAHKLAVIVYLLIVRGGTYKDHGDGYEPSKTKARQLKKAIKLIQSMGGRVELASETAMEEPPTPTTQKKISKALKENPTKGTDMFSG